MDINNMLAYIGSKDMSSIEIGPSEAQYILDNHNYYHNRKMQQRKIEAFAREMTNGKWSFGASNLKFARFEDKLYLMDGQHRLSAIVESGLTISFPFITISIYSEQELAKFYDIVDAMASVKMLSDSSQFSILQENIDIPRAFLSKCARAIAIIYHGFTYYQEPKSNENYVHYVEDWKNEIEIVYDLYNNSTIKKRVRANTVIAFILLTVKYQREKAIEFWSKSLTGEMLQQDDPRKRLYDYLAYKRLDDMEVGRSRWIQYALYMNTAWSAFLENSEYKKPLTVTNIKERDLIVNGTPYNTSLVGNGINSVAIRRGEAHIKNLKMF